MTENQASGEVIRKVWYKIYYSDVTTNREGIDLSTVLISPRNDWDDLKRQLIDEVPGLEGYHVSQLGLYRDEESLQKNQRMRLNEMIGDTLGNSSSPIILLVSGANSKKLRLSAGEQPRSVWYTLVRDTIDGIIEAPAASVPMRPQQLLYDLKVHCKPPDHSRDIANFEDQIKVYDAENKPLDGSTPIEGLVTTANKPLRVVLPREYKTFEWKPLVPSSSLNDANLFFVNRDQAVRDLLKICFENEARKGPDVGDDMQIGIIDQVYGMGKTGFGYNFINQCKSVSAEEFPDDRERLERILKARTLSIRFLPNSLLPIMQMKDQSRKLATLQRLIGNLILEKVKALISPELSDALAKHLNSLADDQRTTSELLSKLMFLTGEDPIFIVLDEVGAAFDGRMRVLNRRNLFMQFCDQFLIKWLEMPDLHFVIVGRGSVFEWVGERPYENDAECDMSPMVFKRIPLTMIRADKINLILGNTLRPHITSGEMVSLDEYYSFNADEKAAAVSSILEQTNGHPRSMYIMLKACKSQDALHAYRDPGNFDRDPVDRLLNYQDKIREFLKAIEVGETMDLTSQVWTKGMTLSQLANKAKLRWEGDVSNAKLYASPAVLRTLSILCSSFLGYLAILRPKIGLELKWDRHFEILLLKRLQGMFQTPICPSQVASSVFPERTPFGSLEQFGASQKISGFPKITKQSSRSRTPAITSKTVHPNNWPALLKLMKAMGSGTFLPAEQSSSSDGFIVHTNETNLTVVGVAAKGRRTKLPVTHVEREIELFNRAFGRPTDTVNNSPPQSPRIRELHVLLVFCTGGFSRLVRRKEPPIIRRLVTDLVGVIVDSGEGSEDAGDGSSMADGSQESTSRAYRDVADLRVEDPHADSDRDDFVDDVDIPEDQLVPDSQTIDYRFNREVYQHVDSVLLIDLSTPASRADFFAIVPNSDLQENLEFITNPNHPFRIRPSD